MNGLKQVNDTYGHDVGDLALKMYLQAIADAIGDRGQAFRLGGDEVLVVLPGHDDTAAVGLLELASRKLMSEHLEPMGKKCLLSISAGVITCSDPRASPRNLRSAADKVQYRAKQESKGTEPRPSVIAINGTDEMKVITHVSDVDRNPS
jgi:diguanylate cyclase (GGDEF)-like protein